MENLISLKIRGLVFTEMLMDDNERFLFQWWRVLKKGKLKLVLDHTLKKSKSGGYKKLRTSAADGYAGFSNREILKVTNNNSKYNIFTARFTNKAAPKAVIASEVNSTYSNIYICPFLTNGGKSHKLHFKVFKETRWILENVVILDFRKNGNMLEALDWNLNFSALRHLKTCVKVPIYYFLPFVRNLFQDFKLFSWQKEVIVCLCKNN